MDRIVIAHAHIFKNAGTTIDWILQRNFGKKFLDDRNDQLIRSDTEYVAKLLSKNKKLKAFSSHSLPLPVNQIEGIDLQVMCMLRHPLLRVRSVYDFERKQMADTPGAKYAKNATFQEYVRWRMLPETNATIKDMQVRFLTKNNSIDNSLGQDHLQAAIEYVESHELVGVVERFDQSMVLFERHFKKIGFEFNPVYIKQNITEKESLDAEFKLTQLRSDLGDDLYGVLIANNQLDLALYEFTLKLLTRRFDSFPNAQKKLSGLRSKSEKLKR